MFVGTILTIVAIQERIFHKNGRPANSHCSSTAGPNRTVPDAVGPKDLWAAAVVAGNASQSHRAMIGLKIENKPDNFLILTIVIHLGLSHSHWPCVHPGWWHHQATGLRHPRMVHANKGGVLHP